VNSIPIGRAVELGCVELYVLHVWRVAHPLSRKPDPLELELPFVEETAEHARAVTPRRWSIAIRASIAGDDRMVRRPSRR
jgi:hypothetical protein